MRVVFFFFLHIPFLFANSSHIKEIKIHDILVKSIFSTTNNYVYTNSKDLENHIKVNSLYMNISTQEFADYIILCSQEELLNEKAIVLVTSYALLKNNKRAIGAFYWKKGRPTIIFIRQRLKEQNIVLPSSMEKYYEDEKCLYELCF